MTPQEFGELIRAHREARSLSLEELASRFKLSVSTVRGIEEGSLDHMPHAVYAKGFVRAYAQAVGVAPEELQAGLVALFPEEVFADVPTVPSPINGKASNPRRYGRGFPLLFLLLAFALVGVAGWYVVTHFDSLRDVASQYFSAASPESDDSSRANTPVPEQPQPPESIPETAPGTTSGTMPGTTLNTTSGTIVGTPAGAASASSAPVAQTGSAPEAQDPTGGGRSASVGIVPPAADTVPAGEKQVSIDAIEECWVQVSVDGSTSRAFTVYPGETSILPYKTKLLLVLGNAGGVILTHGGKPYAHNSRRNEKKTFTFQ